MTLYMWFFAMIVASICWLVWFLYSPLRNNEMDLNKSNVDLGKKKQEELKQDLSNDMIDINEFNQAKSEITQTLAQELKQSNQSNQVNKPSKHYIAVGCILVLLPLLSLGVYELLSKKDTVAVTSSNQEQQSLSLEKSVEEIKLYLLDQPDDDVAWASLGSVYTQLNNFDEALKSYEKSYQLNSADPVILSEYASAIFFANNQQFNQKSIDLLKQALEIDSTLPFALYQIGLYAASNGDFDLAKTSWQRALMSIPAGNSDRRFIEELIMQLDEVMAPSQNPVLVESSEESHSVNVKLLISDETMSSRSDEDYLMVYVKLAHGRPMPIAIQKIVLKDFSGYITLTDTDSVMSSQKLSQSDEVIAVVRISKTGSAIKQDGDIQVQSDVINVRDNPTVNLIM